jgi:hypothetical protein
MLISMRERNLIEYVMVYLPVYGTPL